MHYQVAMPNPAETEYLPDFAPEWFAQWRLAANRLAELHLERLANLTESEAGRIFALLDPPRPYELRSTSGLVEQQRLFGKLRDSAIQDGQVMEDKRDRPGGPGTARMGS